ncbi:hypothetical protein TRIUR3_22244 [Triticum urartu]|uniref:Uncharacterized protein n=1 Tax=Triticum urartu TaxID=4572 RepID=M7ZX07_TRIUA|nr:hypothetical protein TRIUR3_22244 [Triticum urartu]
MAFFSHHHLQQPHPAAPPPQQQQQPPAPLSFRNALPVPIDGQIPAPLAFFNAPPAFPDQAGQPQMDAAGLTAAAGMGWRQPREQELLGENSQMSSIDFLQTGSAVSTGLALSLEDRRHGGGGAGAGNSSGDSPLLLLPMLDDDISREVQRLDADMDRFIRAQAKQFEALASVEDKILRKIRDKESEVQNINKRNLELEDQIKQMAGEVGAWQQRAKYNESMISALKYNLEQVCAHQSKDFKEGCGDSEVDDTASCCNGGAVNLQLMPKENNHPKDLTACRAPIWVRFSRPVSDRAGRPAVCANRPTFVQGLGARSYDGSPLRRQAFESYLSKSIMSSSPTSTLLSSPPKSPPSESPPLSPDGAASFRRGSWPGVGSPVNDVLASLRQLRLAKAQASPSGGWAGYPTSPAAYGSPKAAGLYSLPTTPMGTQTSASSFMANLEPLNLRFIDDEEPVQRVESGRALREKVFERLSRDGAAPRSCEVVGAGAGGPDVGWVSDLIN